MKIALASRPYDGPWGGGNRFVAALKEGLESRGHTVTHGLDDRDIDIILLTEVRPRSPNVAFSTPGIVRYLTLRNPSALVVHRINECDERKNEAFINARLIRANYLADVTAFVGTWLTELPTWRENLHTPWRTLLNGADTRIFNPAGFTPWTGEGPLRLVTHHWGFHRMKGFDVYEQIDALLDDPAWKDRIAFTYVGNLPKGFSFRNARYVPPLDGEALASELRRHQGYVTASINEPGGNHQNEGALCGLPLLYRESGCMPEYCTGYGVSFTGPGDFVAALQTYIRDYPNLAARMPDYPHTAARMVADWTAFLEQTLADRAKLLSARRLWRSPGLLLANVLNVV